MTQKMVFTVLQTVTSDKGEFIPCIVKEGEKGYYKTDWEWGTDFEIATQIANERNESMGYTPEEVNKIILRSMF